jgi:hypothetical protein
MLPDRHDLYIIIKNYSYKLCTSLVQVYKYFLYNKHPIISFIKKTEGVGGGVTIWPVLEH